MERRAVATHPGSLQRRGELAFWGSLLGASVVVVVAAETGIGRTMHVTAATALNKLPSYGHSSTISLILPAKTSLPDEMTLSMSSSFTHPCNGRLAVALQPRALGLHFRFRTYPFAFQYSKNSRLYSSSKSVACAPILSLQCSPCSVCELKALSVAEALHPDAAHLSVVSLLSPSNHHFHSHARSSWQEHCAAQSHRSC